MFGGVRGLWNRACAAAAMYSSVITPMPTNKLDHCAQTWCASWCRHGWTRVIVEKPFGRDSASSAELGRGLKEHLQEEQVRQGAPGEGWGGVGWL